MEFKLNMRYVVGGKLILMIFFLSTFISISIYLMINKQIQTNIIYQIIESIICMVGLVILNMNHNSKFLSSFTSTAFLFFSLDILFPMIKSLIDNKDIIIKSFLATSEGFIITTLAVYLFLRFLNVPFERNKI